MMGGKYNAHGRIARNSVARHGPCRSCSQKLNARASNRKIATPRPLDCEPGKIELRREFTNLFRMPSRQDVARLDVEALLFRLAHAEGLARQGADVVERLKEPRLVELRED